MVAAAQLRLRQLANGHRVGYVMRVTRGGIGDGHFDGLKVLHARKDRIERVSGPVFIEEAHRMNFRSDGLVERLRPLLPEPEGSDVVDGAPRRPAVAQVRLSRHVEAGAAVLLRGIDAIRRAAVLHPVQNGVEIGAFARLAAEVHVMRKTPGSVVLNQVSQIVTAFDGPVVTDPQHEAALRAVSDVGGEETALARLPLERMVEEGRVEQRHLPQEDHGAVSDGALSGDDIELGTGHPPPRVRHFAVGDPSLIQDVLFADTLGPLALKVEWAGGGERAGTGGDARVRFAADVVELSRLVLGVVLQVVRPDLLVAIKSAEVDMAGGVDVAGALVVLDIVGAEKHPGVFHLDGVPVPFVHRTVAIRRIGNHIPLADGNGFRWYGRGRGGGCGRGWILSGGSGA